MNETEKIFTGISLLKQTSKLGVVIFDNGTNNDPWNNGCLSRLVV